MGLFGAVICILLVIAALVGICLLAIRWMKDRSNRGFDERQKKAINEGYQACYLVGFFYYMAVSVYFVRLDAGEELAVSPFLLVYIGVMIQIAFQYIYELLTHSAMPLTGRPKADIIGWLFCSGIMGYGLVVMGKRYAGFPVKGEGVVKWVFLLSGAVSLLRAVGTMITLLRKEKEEE